MKRSVLALVCLLGAAGSAACSSKDAQSGAGPLTFVSAPLPGAGASVSLRRQEASVLFPDRVTVDVVARGAADLHGAAFRLSWDPSALGFLEAKSGAPWSKQAIAMAKEGSPGELAIVWAERGETGIDANRDTLLGTIVFEVRDRKGSAIAFKNERSQLVDRKGVRVEATWTGGQIAR